MRKNDSYQDFWKSAKIRSRTTDMHPLRSQTKCECGVFMKCTPANLGFGVGLSSQFFDVTDDVEGTVVCPSATLEPGESLDCTLSGTVVAGPYANLGRVDVREGFRNRHHGTLVDHRGGCCRIDRNGER